MESIEFTGEWDVQLQGELEQFIRALSAHERGCEVAGRLVLASGDGSGAELREWMQPAEYSRWRKKAELQPSTAVGKTFIAHDSIVTAVVAPLDQKEDFLHVVSHELIEMGHLGQIGRDGAVYPADGPLLLGSIFFDEYATERVRFSIATDLGWPLSPHDQDNEMGLIDLATEIEDALPAPRYNPPGNDFWASWQTLARVWAMTCGRRAAGSSAAERALRAWRDHSLIDDDGWSPAEAALSELFDETKLERDQLWRRAARLVAEPITQSGLDKWSEGVATGR